MERLNHVANYSLKRIYRFVRSLIDALNSEKLEKCLSLARVGSASAFQESSMESSQMEAHISGVRGDLTDEQSD